MESLALSLAVVVSLEFVVFVLLYKYTRWQGKQVAFLIILVVLGLYFPYGIINWRGLDWFAIHFAFYVTIPYVLGIITSNWEVRERIEGPSRTKWFHWGPATMVGFFILLATVDSTIISFAQNGVSSKVTGWLLPEPRNAGKVNSIFPGTVANDFHEKESLFNEYLANYDVQVKRGWVIKKGWLTPAVAGRESMFQVQVLDKSGEAIAEAEVSVLFLRPSDQRLDQTLVMSESAPGIYQIPIELPIGGTWDVVIDIVKGEDEHQLTAATRIASSTDGQS